MTKESFIKINEGKHFISVQTLKKETDEPSAMASYLAPSAIVTQQDGSLMLTLMLEDHKTTTGFQVETQAGALIEAIEQQVNEETNKRFEMFKLDRLPIILPVRVQYEVLHDGENIKGDEALRLIFDETSLEEIG